MPLSVGSGESESDFTSRCIRHYMDKGRPQKQAVAICMSEWRDSKGMDGEDDEPCEAESCDECPEETKAGCKKPKREEEKARADFMERGFHAIVEEYYRLADDRLIVL